MRNMQVVPSTEAPRMEIIRHIIEEDGEIYEQVDSYNNETGEVVINVPSHGDREPVNIVLDPNTVSENISKEFVEHCNVENACCKHRRKMSNQESA